MSSDSSFFKSLLAGLFAAAGRKSIENYRIEFLDFNLFIVVNIVANVLN